MPGLLCDCCKLPVLPMGGEHLCECPCDNCRGEQICHGCREIMDNCRCDPDDDLDEWEGVKDDWRKSAERENARRTAAAPLLAHAGLVPLVSPAERQARMESEREAFQRRQQESAVQTAERTAHLLGQALVRIEPADQERVRRYLAVYPVEYGPTLLTTMLARLDAGLSALEEQQAPTPETVAEWRRRGSLVAAVYNHPTPEEQVLLDQARAADAAGARQARKAALAALSEARGRRIALAFPEQEAGDHA